MKDKYYIIPVWGCVEPEALIGPYKTFRAMVRRAKKVYMAQDQDDAIFWMRTGKGRPVVDSFSGADLGTD